MAFLFRLVAFCMAALSVAWLPQAAAQDSLAPAGTLQADAPVPDFDVIEFRIEGNSVLPAGDVERAVAPFLGYAQTIAEVEAARQALEKTYHASGYLTVLVDIPEQDVKSGIVRLVVTEGSIQRLRVTGSRYFSLGRIRAQAPSLAPGSVPYFPDVQQDLAALNRMADRRVTPVLKPGRTPGTVQVELKVDDNFPLHGSLELNDRYSGDTTRTRLGAMVRYDNLFQREHSLTLNAQTSPEDFDETRALSASYLFRRKPSDHLVALYAVRSRSDVAAVGDLRVLGDADIYGLRYIVPLRADESRFHSLTVGVDRKEFLESLVLRGADSLTTPISYSPLTLDYSSTRTKPRGTREFALGATVGLRGVLGNQEAEFADKRFKASASYLTLRARVGAARFLTGSWSASGRIDAQLASGPLVSSEQFAAGGQDSVRGYREAEAQGDDGIRINAELRRQFGDRWQASLFAESASLWVQRPLPGQTARFNLLGGGIGLRAKAKKGLALSLDAAHAFRDAGATRRGDTRAHFNVLVEF